MNAPVSASHERRRVGVRRSKKHSLKTDMTPMVDLGFLLITFFVITTELVRPKTSDLLMPKDGPIMKVGESDAMTVLPAKDNVVYYYEGEWQKALADGAVYKTTLSYSNGLGDVIRQKQEKLDNNPAAKEGRAGLMLIIRPGKEASYSALVDLLDEVLINDVKKYVITKQSREEMKWLQEHQ